MAAILAYDPRILLSTEANERAKAKETREEWRAVKLDPISQPENSQQGKQSRAYFKSTKHKIFKSS